jgi:hypothetical protein
MYRLIQLVWQCSNSALFPFIPNTKSFLSPTIHSSFPNPLIFAPSSLYNHLAQLAPLPSSHFSVLPSVLASNSLVILSAILPLYFGIISPLPCTNLPKIILSNSFSTKLHLPTTSDSLQVPLSLNTQDSCSPALTPTMPPLTSIRLTARPTLLTSSFHPPGLISRLRPYCRVQSWLSTVE